jgi:hypothetical protein
MNIVDWKFFESLEFDAGYSEDILQYIWENYCGVNTSIGSGDSRKERVPLGSARRISNRSLHRTTFGTVRRCGQMRLDEAKLLVVLDFSKCRPVQRTVGNTPCGTKRNYTPFYCPRFQLWHDSI